MLEFIHMNNYAQKGSFKPESLIFKHFIEVLKCFAHTYITFLSLENKFNLNLGTNLINESPKVCFIFLLIHRLPHICLKFFNLLNFAFLHPKPMSF